MKFNLIYMTITLLIIITSIIPNLSENKRIKIHLLTSSNLSKILLLTLLFFISFENIQIGVLFLILLFGINNITIKFENFKNYYNIL